MKLKGFYRWGTILALRETISPGGALEEGRWVGAGTESAVLRSSRQEEETKGPEGTREANQRASIMSPHCQEVEARVRGDTEGHFRLQMRK